MMKRFSIIVSVMILSCSAGMAQYKPDYATKDQGARADLSVQCIETNLTVISMPTNSGSSGNGLYAWDSSWKHDGWTTGRWQKAGSEYDYNSMAYRTNDTKLILFSGALLDFGGGRQWESSNGIYGPFTPSSGGATGTGTVSVSMQPGYVPKTTTDYIRTSGDSFSTTGYVISINTTPNGGDGNYWAPLIFMFSGSTNNIVLSHGDNSPGPSGSWTKLAVHDSNQGIPSGQVDADILSSSNLVFRGTNVIWHTNTFITSILTNETGSVTGTVTSTIIYLGQ